MSLFTGCRKMRSDGCRTHDSCVCRKSNSAIGVREHRWPDECRVYKPAHGNLNNARVLPIWTGWQRALDKFLSDKVSQRAAYRARVLFDYPRRKIRGVESVIGPSIERNFVQPASGWARGAVPRSSQPENWGLSGVPLDERTLCRAAWEANTAIG